MISQKKLNILKTISLLLILANYFVFQNSVLGLVFGLLYLTIYGLMLGKWLFPKMPLIFQTSFGILSLLFIYLSILWVSFYLWQINSLIFVSSVLIVSLLLEIINHKNELLLSWKFQKFRLNLKFSLFSYLVLIGSCFFLLISRETTDSIASPWHVLPNTFFIFFIFATINLIWILLRYRRVKLRIILTCTHLFLMSSVAFFIYKIGYGYDPFLHFAAMKNIVETGTLSPKPFYYLGEYSLIIFLHNLTQISLDLINRLLLPLLFSIFLPISVYYGLTIGKNLSKKYSFLLILLTAFIPLTFFISTTPQGLTNLLLLMIIFLSFISTKHLPRFYILFLSMITCLIHPLYGIPAFLYALYIVIKYSKSNSWFKSISKFCIVLGSFVVYPLMFFLNSSISQHKVVFQYSPLTISFPSFEKQYNFIQDLIHVYGFGYKIIYCLLFIVSLYLLLQRKKLRKYGTQVMFGIIFLGNYLTLRMFVNLSFGTNSNIADFEERILELSMYFFLPVFSYGFYIFFSKFLKRFNSITKKTFAVFMLVFILTQSLYFTYPLDNDYINSNSFNISKSDMETVNFIEDNTEGDYIVLANQMVGAAAIHELGFKKYYNEQFFYSIPDGSEKNLYQYFESMVYDEPKVEYMNQAMEQSGVNQAYFVINSFWTKSSIIVEKAKQTSDKWYIVDIGKNYIFYFKKK